MTNPVYIMLAICFVVNPSIKKQREQGNAA